MADQYFRQVPNFQYIDRNYDNKYIGNYVEVKNLFKRVKLRDEIFENLNYFSRYLIPDGQRPDTVAYEFYKDETLDWLVLLSNNILNIYDEWPLFSENFEKVMLEKYGSYEKLNDIHHYQTQEVKNSLGDTIMPAGIIVSEQSDIQFYDEGLGKEVLVDSGDYIIPITNFEFEQEKEDEKKLIYLLKPKYLGIIFDDLSRIMEYKEGGTQFLSPTLKKADDIRLYT